MGAKTYTDLIRDREMAKQKYEDMDAKLERAKRSEEMENRHEGEGSSRSIRPRSRPIPPSLSGANSSRSAPASAFCWAS